MTAANPDEDSMMTKAREDAEPGRTEVEELLDRRATIEDWLARLDEQKGKVSERIIARVREDYRSRLQAALDSLGAHRRSIQEQVDQARALLASTEALRAQAAEELEEAQLRTLIGEIDEAVWADQEPRLKAVVSETAETAAKARAEAERLSAILTQLDERERSASGDDDSPTLTIGIAEPVDDLEVDSGTDFEAGETIEAIGIATVVELPVDEFEETEAFLTEIDRALATTQGQDVSSEDGEADTAPKPGVKCGECGYTNDLNAWFCGVCGADVG